ncbi:uncharacterized protein C1orf159 homolog isoform X26 [Tursiops truncatus]|uniref:Uncharacterized protein C1orf159 homolog isoform X19 n=1 Tax=Tursiops truncatus TaxID=9739 RepID=A0A6J3QI71_TURTR|nr:uncharacterized protein C1orf159 homolog isoform X19 [Tursiops truncatus]
MFWRKGWEFSLLSPHLGHCPSVDTSQEPSPRVRLPPRTTSMSHFRPIWAASLAPQGSSAGPLCLVQDLTWVWAACGASRTDWSVPPAVTARGAHFPMNRSTGMPGRPSFARASSSPWLHSSTSSVPVSCLTSSMEETKVTPVLSSTAPSLQPGEAAAMIPPPPSSDRVPATVWRSGVGTGEDILLLGDREVPRSRRDLPCPVRHLSDLSKAAPCPSTRCLRQSPGAAGGLGEQKCLLSRFWRPPAPSGGSGVGPSCLSQPLGLQASLGFWGRIPPAAAASSAGFSPLCLPPPPEATGRWI